MSAAPPDVIDLLAGIEPASPLYDIRNQRAQARENAQKSYLALFEPEVPGDLTTVERFAVANFVAGLHRQPAVAEFYAAGLHRLAERRISDAIVTEISRGSTRGPYGRYPDGPLSVEDVAGPGYQVAPENQQVLGRKLIAALEHAHLLVFHPRDASPAALQTLLNAGWSTTGIVTLSQLISFLAFQIRVVAGLRTLSSASEAPVDVPRTAVFTGVLASGRV
ncbi:CMD domain protein [Microvirga aerophila]|uniref:CMD domain protein n=1 Tax=Microvirga aerophila TaxID=670291 RepID=A0A512BXD4_9HYPH|nr:CMD domain protein [Microvirga aerophila]GEO16616.1 CMD domain protein [Microvirga aerophila]